MTSYDLGVFNLKMTTNQYGAIWHEAIFVRRDNDFTRYDVIAFSVINYQSSRG